MGNNPETIEYVVLSLNESLGLHNVDAWMTSFL